MENASGFACGASASVGIAPASAAHSLAIAIELSLKAYLMKAGYADDWNRVHIRHDLEKALALATEAGLSGLPLELQRSEERRVGKACVSQGRSTWVPSN